MFEQSGTFKNEFIKLGIPAEDYDIQINCEPTQGFTMQKNPHPKIVYKQHGEKQVTGQCDEQRSMISPDYARNFICDQILGITQKRPNQQLTLF